MAERRMFSKSITSSDNFLEMPDSTQCLYFHLSMNADDDGFVDKPKSIVRMIGAKEDDLKILMAKSYILPFENGIIVIRHWRLNNYIQNDRKKNTIYQNELKMLRIDSEGAYTLGYGNALDEKKQPKPLTLAQQKRLDERKNSDLPYSFDYKIKARFLGRQCPLCGKTMTTLSNQTRPTIQHNTPISKGGKHEIDNISIICGECNYSIQDKVTSALNNDEVKELWKEIIASENVSGMDTQDSIGKDNITINNSFNINNNNSSSSSDDGQAVSNDKQPTKKQYILTLFDKIWAIYPKKVSKEQAKKTWLKKLINCKDNEKIYEKAKKISQLLGAHINSWKQEGRNMDYVPHFSSWLNNEIPDKEE